MPGAEWYRRRDQLQRCQRLAVLDSQPSRSILPGLSTSAYQILIRDLPAKREIDIPPSFVAEATRGLAVREALGAPPDDPSVGAGHLSVELSAEGTHVFANGRISGKVTVACSRCVEPVQLCFDEPVRVSFLPATEFSGDDDADPADPAGEDGAAITEDDLDLFGYSGETIDLEPLIREQFVLVVPYAPLCSETCRGLCLQCGRNRNQETCSCEAVGDPRLAGLKALKFPS